MIDYNKTFNTNVITNLHMLMKGEFRESVIRYDNKFIGSSFFKIRPIEDEIVELRTDGLIREYSVEISYYQKNRGKYTKNKSLEKRISIIERLKEIIRRNTASIEEFLFMVTSQGKDYLTSDGENFVIVKRPILVTSQDDFFVTADPLAYTVFPDPLTYEFHNARLEAVNYDLESENSNYLKATADFKCLVEEVYA